MHGVTTNTGRNGQRTAVGAVLDMNLEEFRQQNGLTYAELAEFFGWSQAKTAERYAKGEILPKPDRLQAIVDKSAGRVSVLAMHTPRRRYIEENASDVIERTVVQG